MKSKLMSKRARMFTAATWNGPLDKTLLREDKAREERQQEEHSTLINSVWKSIRQGLNKLRQDNFMVKPGKPLSAVRLSQLPQGDVQEQQAYRRICGFVNQFLAETYSEAQLKEFQAREGNLPQALVHDDMTTPPKPVQSRLVRKRRQR